MPLDRDLLSLGVDYSKTGSLTLAHMLTLPNADEVERFMRVLPQHGVEQAMRMIRHKEQLVSTKTVASLLSPDPSVRKARERNNGASRATKAWRKKSLNRRAEPVMQYVESVQ